MKKKLYIIITIFALAVNALAAGLWAGLWYKENRVAAFDKKVDVYVEKGTTISDVLAQIGDALVEPKAMQRVIKAEKLDCLELFPGHYVAEKGMSAQSFATHLRKGWQTPVRLVISGTPRTKAQLAKKISTQIQLDSAMIHEALCNDVLLSHYGFSSQNVFAMILPDTYEVYWNISIEGLLERMKKEHDAFWTSERRDKAGSINLTPDQVYTLASIVCQETNQKSEFPMIASVYLNRLRKGMPLQACPTVLFCYDYTLTRVLLRHLKVDSPYNTYTHKGLPPGPICVASKAVIDAVLNPSAEKYLFFCAAPEMNGTHRFAKTSLEHSHNAAAYHTALEKYLKEKKEQKQ